MGALLIGVNAHADETAEQNAAGKAGSAGGGNLLGQYDDLGLEPRQLKRDLEIGIAVHLNRTRRNAGVVLAAADRSARAGRRRCDRDLFCPTARVLS